VKISHRVVRFAWPGPDNRLNDIATLLLDRIGSSFYPLRFAIVGFEGRKAVCEAAVVQYGRGEPYSSSFSEAEILAPRTKQFQAASFGVVQIIPTGIRCDYGGYAGDAAPATNLLAAVADYVVTHPNAVNASDLNEMASNVLYVEGKSLDDFMLGHLGLRLSKGKRIGTFVDPTGASQADDVIQVLNAAQAAAGIDCDLCNFLESPLGVQIDWSPSGSASGSFSSVTILLDGVAKLIERGAEAVGGVSVIHGVDPVDFQSYLSGNRPNPSGTVEALITHLISKVFRIPCAHAPLPYYTDEREPSTVNPRAAAEFISRPHYFSVLKGLHSAPLLVQDPDLGDSQDGVLTLNHVGAIVAPASSLGGVPMLAAELSGIPIIAVEENTTILAVTNEKLQMRNVITVSSYLEAAGVIAALRSGISLKSLGRPLLSVKTRGLRVGQSQFAGKNAAQNI
jgi:hypothetical protein